MSEVEAWSSRIYCRFHGWISMHKNYEFLFSGYECMNEIRTVGSRLYWFVWHVATMWEEPLDTTDKGYQPPIHESLVKEFDPEDKLMPRRVRFYWRLSGPL